VRPLLAELEEYKDVLEFQAEYQLTTEPLRKGMTFPVQIIESGNRYNL
jgi:hypothetical protein